MGVDEPDVRWLCGADCGSRPDELPQAHVRPAGGQGRKGRTRAARRAQQHPQRKKVFIHVFIYANMTAALPPNTTL